jgi:hypothetical protein
VNTTASPPPPPLQARKHMGKLVCMCVERKRKGYQNEKVVLRVLPTEVLFSLLREVYTSERTQDVRAPSLLRRREHSPCKARGTRLDMDACSQLLSFSAATDGPAWERSG